MKVTALFLAALLAVLTAFGQEPANGSSRNEAAKGKREPAASAVDKSSQSGDDLLRIPSPGAASDMDLSTTTLLKLARAGGWAMIPLAFLSVITVMLVLVYLFTLRRSAIISGCWRSRAGTAKRSRVLCSGRSISPPKTPTLRTKRSGRSPRRKAALKRLRSSIGRFTSRTSECCRQ